MITKHNFYALRRLIRQMKKANPDTDNLLSVMGCVEVSMRDSMSAPLNVRLLYYKAQWKWRLSPFPVSRSACTSSLSSCFSTARTALLFDELPTNTCELFYTLRRSCRTIGIWETDELFYQAWRSCNAPYGAPLSPRVRYFKQCGKLIHKDYRIPLDERFW